MILFFSVTYNCLYLSFSLRNDPASCGGVCIHNNELAQLCLYLSYIMKRGPYFLIVPDKCGQIQEQGAHHIRDVQQESPPLCVGNNTKKSGLYKYVLRHTSSSSSPRHRDGEEGSRPREFVMAPKAYTKCYYYLSFLFVLIYVSIHKESALSFFFCGGVGGDAFELILCGPQSGQMRPSFRVVVQFKCRGRERIIAHWTCFQFTWPRKRVSPFYVVWRWRVVFPFPKVT